MAPFPPNLQLSKLIRGSKYSSCVLFTIGLELSSCDHWKNSSNQAQIETVGLFLRTNPKNLKIQPQSDVGGQHCPES